MNTGGRSMKAALLTEWNKIEILDVSIPEIKSEECLVKIRYAGICGSDLHIYGGHHPTATIPRILGHEFVGVIEDINSKRTDIHVGDRVTAEPLISCGCCNACIEGNFHVCKNLNLHGIHCDGAFAEYIKVDARKIIKIGENLSDTMAVLSEPFAVGYHVNRRAGTKPGDLVLVIGGGPIGLITGIMAKISGAYDVVFSEINFDRIQQIKQFGFLNVINPLTEDVNAKIMELTDNNGFDVVFEVSGSQQGMSLSTYACKIRGTIIPVGFPGKIPEVDILKVIFKECSIIGSRVYTLTDFKKTLLIMENIKKEGKYHIEKLISNIYSLDEIEIALLMMKEVKNQGKLIIRMSN